MPSKEPVPVVEMRDICVEFPGVKALDAVDFRLLPGEVHALMGENGAGKSTLIKALTGVYPVDSGQIIVDGTPRSFTGPRQSQEAGISTVYQEVNLCANLSVGENILLGREPRRWGHIDYRTLHRRAGELLAQLELDIDSRSRLGAHPIAVQQLVAITRATAMRSAVLILDEPTSSLDAGEVSELFGVIRRLRDTGTAILFVSHFLDQIYAISDRITVLRNGKLVGEYLTTELPRVGLVTAMLGRAVDALDEVADTTAAIEVTGTPVVSLQGLGRVPAVEPLTLDIRRGEIIGLAGLLGSGRTELARLIFGADRATAGQLCVDGRRVIMRTPRTAIDHRFAFTSENRKEEGVFGELTVRDNLVLALQARRGFARPLSARAKDELVDKYMEAFDIRPRRPDALMKNLSGGNQQKVLLARWLITEPQLFILDEPTRGIDIGAKTQIQKLVTELAAGGMAVLFISAELEEVTRVSHRIAVMRDRRNVAQVDTAQQPDLHELIAAGPS